MAVSRVRKSLGTENGDLGHLDMQSPQMHMDYINKNFKCF